MMSLNSYGIFANLIKDFSYPFFLDKKKEFVKKNDFMGKFRGFETVLTDKNNTILLMGNPVKSKEIRELYLKTILNSKKKNSSCKYQKK